jgi:hypothetical protein
MAGTEDVTGWSIRKFVRTTRRYRTMEIQAGAHTITAADPMPGDRRDTLDHIRRAFKYALTCDKSGTRVR